MSWYDPRTWLKGRGKERPAQSLTVSDAVSLGLSRTRVPPKRDVVAVLDAYSKMPRLRAVVDLIANKGAATNWEAYRARKAPRHKVRSMLRGATYGKPAAYHSAIRKAWLKQATNDGLIEQLDTHPVLEFLDASSKFLSGHDTRRLMMLHQELAGECFATIERYAPSRQGVLGRPECLLPLTPHSVLEFPHKGNDEHYLVQIPNGEQRRIHRDDAVYMKFANPLDPYGRGVGIARTLANELDVDEYAAQAASALFYNNGTPDTIVVMPGVSEPEALRIKETWRDQHGGHLKRRVPYFTDAKDIKVERIDQSFVDMDLVNIREVEARIIRQTWGVPPESLGDVSNSNRSTITQSSIIFGSLVLVPRLESWADTINDRIVPNFRTNREIDLGIETFVTYESPVPTDADLELEYARLSPWARSLDEAREAQGLSKRGDKIGEMHVVPAGMVLVNLEQFAKRSAEEMQPKDPPPVVVAPPVAPTPEPEAKPADDVKPEAESATADDSETDDGKDDAAEAKRVHGDERLNIVLGALPVEQRAAVRRALVESAMRGERRRTVLERVRGVVPQTAEGRQILAAVAAQYGRRRARMRAGG